MTLRLSLTVASALASSMLAAGASAHVCMVAPVSRVGANCTSGSPQKDGPCGIADRGSNVTVFRPGETITVKLNETIGHDSHYRIAFNPNGDDFEDPTSTDDKNGEHPFVLKDNITDETVDDGFPDNASVTQSVQVTLPNMPCENCTLQLIQVMYDKGGNGFGGDDGPGGKADNDDIYYACADIALRGEPVGPGADGGAPLGDASVPRDASTANEAGTPAGGDGGTPSGGASGSGGTTGSGTAGAGGTTSGMDAPGDDDEEGGCACAATSASARRTDLLGVSLFALGLLARRRRIRG
jgi:MYXO-CTERM domain-containing protein